MFNFLPTNVFLTARDISNERGKKIRILMHLYLQGYCCDLEWWRSVVQVVESVMGGSLFVLTPGL